MCREKLCKFLYRRLPEYVRLNGEKKVLEVQIYGGISLRLLSSHSFIFEKQSTFSILFSEFFFFRRE